MNVGLFIMCLFQFFLLGFANIWNFQGHYVIISYALLVWPHVLSIRIILLLFFTFQIDFSGKNASYRVTHNTQKARKCHKKIPTVCKMYRFQSDFMRFVFCILIVRVAIISDRCLLQMAMPIQLIGISNWVYSILSINMKEKRSK